MELGKCGHWRKEATKIIHIFRKGGVVIWMGVKQPKNYDKEYLLL
jgi:hypothetical protein